MYLLVSKSTAWMLGTSVPANPQYYIGYISWPVGKLVLLVSGPKQI